MQIDAYQLHRHAWNRKLLNTYWFLVLLQLPFELLYSFTTKRDASFTSGHLIVSVLTMILILLMLETTNKFYKNQLDYQIISGGAILSFTIIYFNYEINLVILYLLLPIFVSIFYLQFSKIIYSIALSLVSFSILFIVKLRLLADYTFIDLLTILPVLTIISIITFGIIKRGVEILNNLQITTELKQELLIKNIIMDKLSKTDALTDLYNHITFHEYLDELIVQNALGHFCIHIAVLDIDNFKKVNDTYGHRAGDAVLKNVSSTLKHHVGLNDFVARYGGEEFAIIFTEKNTDVVFDLLERIRWQISQMKQEELNGQPVTISIGLSEYQPGTSKELLFAGADQSLYTAKKTGKNRTIIHTAPLKEVR
ncbi:GGDEF domain-containing protein [Paenibacillus sp. CGMCC 1.16610]|uniref:Diguanylate cyclase n=1 Tax=Paenibacillus anseongense TaxID=2682845 RepID=A0ABW9U625_9BACL|nr:MULTISPECIES: GGDEF domain-containing protein [Paenibacillus]MBA2940375.1 GGDEF domain-containing protein [Paenibacillus sp. CGMCC 1.16610]MVQ35552.1 diguanylate cyclase [Paenibacillus anseongense]